MVKTCRKRNYYFRIIIMSLKNIRNFIVILTLLLLSFGFGFRFGQSDSEDKSNVTKNIDIEGKTSAKITKVDFSLFWDVWDRLNRYYIDKSKLNAQNMVYGAVSGMVAALEDPYTVFLPPDQNKETKDDLGGKFEGIGAQLGIKDKKIVVIAPLKSSPAESAGLKSGDWILKVDGKETAGWTLPEAVSKIRGQKGTKVMLSIMHKDASVSSEIAVVRDQIKVPSVEWEVKNVRCNQENSNQCKIVPSPCEDCQKVAYLKLTRFGDQTNDEWNKAVAEIIKLTGPDNTSTIIGLIFDLRNNPGGYLSGSVFIASEFLKDGTVVIQESYQEQKETYNVNRKGKLLTIPMVVLINKGSASASEIVAGALQERGRAKLVGETTFGKGSIQEAQELENGAGIHITTAKWLLPSGKWINGSGIDPDIKAEEGVDENLDPQLDKAAEVLLK
ncbi:hypothetical protein A2Y99_02775 [Candidatus Gottesmanbacteria bacterium RBG_13_37_7]|uniref:PDZ domain-containing protein n=1 Tax=Candidatus Gottesmanbacteria bacterium RBG_13_37_7 TaxID=1798369 RepID=A0A1F5YJZ4_9BACT|nr:MAG: hypothetical protein A2Y99_02775 [Candidatus Gottesmanbacteria bacterium RBG_13_37_7]